MGQKSTDSLCNSCDISCPQLLTADEKDRLPTAHANNADRPVHPAACRMPLLTADLREIVKKGVKARNLQEQALAAWGKQVGGEYCTWRSWPW